MSATVSRLDLGVYEAERAAALSGVPLTTLYDWARKEVVVPSVSATREKLWSYGDLLAARLVRWLRTRKPEAAPTAMHEVRRTLARVGDDLWTVDETGAERTAVKVTRGGKVMIETAEGLTTVDFQLVLEADWIDLIAPFGRAPDLLMPDLHLRIVPGKVSGEPHIVHSRLMTRVVAGLANEGYDLDRICELYPSEPREALGEAITFEAALAA